MGASITRPDAPFLQTGYYKAPHKNRPAPKAPRAGPFQQSGHGSSPNEIRRADSGEPMRNHKAGAVLHQLLHGFLNEHLRAGIDGTGRFIENQMPGSARMARAMVKSWRCPCERFMPSSSRTVSYPSGSVWMKCVTRAICAAASTSSRVAPAGHRRCYHKLCLQKAMYPATPCRTDAAGFPWKARGYRRHLP